MLCSLQLQLHHPSPPLSVSLRPKTSLLKSQPPNPFLRRNRIAGFRRIVACSSPDSDSLPADDFEVELGRLLVLLPEEMRRRVGEHPELQQLIEVVMDLGRKPLARFPTGDFVLSECPISVQDIEHATSQVGDFAIDNRAGISRTLHRISAIRNRKGTIIGLTCRVGRAISGSANLLRDLVQDGSSLLLIGPPGVGKTTIIREVARMLANDCQQRVMIVDTSNEIGGDGDIPHAGIGNARRMQVPNNDMQHKVLIEAVENHMPQVIVIDEIGTELEAMAASTIAQRGIQLVATAHGITIENLIMNPSLEMLVGGIQSVTLGDEEASRRGVQKTVQERKGPSTFIRAVEIMSKTELRVHRSLEATVDAILAGRLPKVEVRKMNSQEIEQGAPIEPVIHTSFDAKNYITINNVLDMSDERVDDNEFDAELPNMEDDSSEVRAPLYLFVYGILEVSVIQGIRQLKIGDDSIQLTSNISEANALLALQNKLKKNNHLHAAAKSHGIPIYVTKTSSLVQITNAIRALMRDYEDGLMDSGSEDEMKTPEKADALEEARIAIEQVVIPTGEPVELLPRLPKIMLLQKELVRKYKLQCEKVGSESNVHLRILPFQSEINGDRKAGEAVHTDDDSDDILSANDNTNGSPYIVDKLPFLSDQF